MKRLFAMCCAAALLMFAAFPVSVQAASENVTLTVAANKSTANPGDTVNFTVKLGAVKELGGGEFVLTIPEGMTIGQSSVPSGLATTLKADGDGVNWDKQSDNTYKWSYASDIEQSYSGTAELPILNFSCTVDANSTFEAKNVTLSGAKLFDATLVDGDFTSHNVNVVPAKVTVEKKKNPVTGVTLDQNTATLQEGATLQLTATVEPSDADEQSVLWSSDNAAVTVSATGLVTAVKEGTANITVTTQEGSKTAVCAVTVTHKHSMSALTPAKAATCEEDGNLAYYTCTKCNKKYADADGTKELANVVLSATGHKPGSEWKTDADNHWKECTNEGCTKKLSVEAHDYKWVVDQAATEDAVGKSHEECACGLKRSENTEIPKLDHVHVKITKHPAVAANCSTEGMKEYWTCGSDKCAGKIYGDEKCQVAVEKESLVLPKDKNTHVYDNEKDGTCNLCGYVRFYTVIEGADGKYSVGSSNGLVIKADGDFEKFTELKVDGKTVDKKNYTAVKGSTVITLKNSYLDTLSAAQHTMELVYSDGKTATTKFTVAAKTESTTTPPATSGAGAATDQGSTTQQAPAAEQTPAAEQAPAAQQSPKTGESNANILWIAVMAGIAMAGTGVMIYKKKKVH